MYIETSEVLCLDLGQCTTRNITNNCRYLLSNCKTDHRSCSATTLSEVIQDHEAFLKEMSCKEIAHELESLGIIPESVKCNILQSKNDKEANAHLLQHLNKDADEESVRRVFKIASEMADFGRMNTFAADMLRKLQ